MRFNISEEWSLKMAELEEGCESVAAVGGAAARPMMDRDVTRVAAAIADALGCEPAGDGDWYLHGVHSVREIAVIAIEAMPSGALTPYGEALVAERDRYRHALANIIARYGTHSPQPKNKSDHGALLEAEQMSMIAEEALGPVESGGNLMMADAAYRLVVDERPYTTTKPHVCGLDIKALANIVGSDTLYMEMPGETPDMPIPDGHTVSLVETPEHSMKRFFSAPYASTTNG